MANPWVHDTLGPSIVVEYKLMRQETRCGVNGEQLIQGRLKYLGEGGGGSLRVSPITANVEQLLDCLGDETEFELRSLQIGIARPQTAAIECPV